MSHLSKNAPNLQDDECSGTPRADTRSAQRRKSRTAKYAEEYREMINFLVKRAKRASAPVSLGLLAHELKEETGSGNKIETIRERLKKLRAKIHEMDKLDTDTKARLLFLMNGKVDKEFLGKLCQTATVKLDQWGRIIEYRKVGLKSEIRENRHVQMLHTEDTPTPNQTPPLPTTSRIAPPPPAATAEIVTTKSGRISKRKNLDYSFIPPNFPMRWKTLKAPPQPIPTASGPPAAVAPPTISRGIYRAPFRNISNMPIPEMDFQDPRGFLPDIEEYNYPRGYSESRTSEDVRRESEAPPDALPGYLASPVDPRGPSMAPIVSESATPGYTGASEYSDRRDAYPRFPATPAYPSAPPPHAAFAPGPPQEYSGYHSGAPINMSTYPRYSTNPSGFSAPHSEPVDTKPPLVVYENIEARGNSSNRNHLMKTEFSEEEENNEIIPLTKHKKFLESIQDLILTLDLPIRGKVQKRIEKKIEQIERFGTRDENITCDEIQSAAITCILIVTKSAKPSVPSESDSTSLRDFLLFLRNAIISMKLPAFNKLQTTLRKSIEDASRVDRRIPVEKMQSGLGTIIDIVAP